MLDSHEEIEFIYQLPLKNLRRFSGGFNCKCPMCNEGSSPNKKRCYILFDNGKIGHNTVVCHNCRPEGISIKHFIELISPSVFEEYCEKEKISTFQKIKDGKLFEKKNFYINQEINNSIDLKYLFNLSTNNFIPASSNKKCIEYCKERKIIENINQLYFCNKSNLMFSNMLIFPFWKNDKIYGFQGRRLDKKIFLTFSPNNQFKIYNIFNVDIDKNVYICEAIIDSMMIDNSIAMLGSDLSSNLLQLIKNRVWCTDNDITGFKKIEKYIANGERVFIWPNEIEEKDFNDLAKKGYTKHQIHDMIMNNIFQGFEALTRIKLKKLRKRN